MKKNKKIIIFNAVLLIVITVLLLTSYYQFSISKSKIGNVSKYAFIALSIVLSMISIVISNILFLKKDISIEKIFLYTMPIICILFMCVMPMFTSHDESRHWLRAYEISTGKLFTQKTDEKVEGTFPKAVIDITDVGYKKIKYKTVVENFEYEINNDEVKTADMANVSVYFPIQYIPQSVGIGIARIFTNKTIVMAYAARLFNIIFCLIILYYALKLMPFAKRGMLMAMLLPISIEGIASISADGITNSMAFLFIAYVLNVIYSKENINYKQIIFLAILSVTIALCKIVYLPLVFLLLLIPKEKFNNSMKKKNIIIAIIILLATIINLVWLKFANTYVIETSNGLSAEKISMIIRNPFRYIQLVAYTVSVNLQRYINILFGSILGWQEFSLGYIVPNILFIMFLFINMTDITSKKFNNKKNNIVYAIILLIILGLIFTSLYIQYNKNKIDTKSIYGIQGRYFIPVLPLIAILLSNIKINTDYSEKSINKTIGIVSIILQVSIMLSIAIVHI